MAIRTVCFDLGGVLVRICHSWQEACELVGIPYKEPERFATAELTSKRRDAVNRFQRGDSNAELYYAELAAGTAELYSCAEVEQLHHAWLIGEYPGVGELLTALHDVAHTACLSNTNAQHWSRLIANPTEYPNIPRLHSKLASHELRALKPDPEIYEAAQRLLESEPSSILFFDDLEPNVLAARAQGWHAERIDPRGDTVEQMRAHLRRYGVL